MEYYEIGPNPWGEECAQIGEDGYNARARAECRAFINQILRHYPAPNEFCTLTTKGFSHDFGRYYEVVVPITKNVKADIIYEWISQIEGDPKKMLENWDQESLAELGLAEKAEEVLQ